MSWTDHDPDEWKTVYESTPCPCNGRCDGHCLGSFSMSTVRRSPEEVAEIRRKKREDHEAKILAEARMIMARRLAQPGKEGGRNG